ncbi:MAG: metal-dependent transcriptional regulator [Evtepia sp.]
MKIHEAAENYLETILMLQRRNGTVRSSDIARELGFSKPTVSEYMKGFRMDGYVTVDVDGHISLSPSGLEIAERIYERHVVIAQFLMTLGVDEETAYADSCKIEHDISEKSFRCLQQEYLRRREKLAPSPD